MEIFQIDWITVDTIIITLLFILLIAVRIFKALFRWRRLSPNKSLIYKKISFKEEKSLRDLILFKKSELVYSKNKQEKNLPLIIMISNQFNRNIQTLLVKGLANYGYNILTIRFKKTRSIIDKSNSNIKEINFSQILKKSGRDSNKDERLTDRGKPYFVISKTTENLKFPLFNEKLNLGFILINPKLTKSRILDNIQWFRVNSQVKRIEVIFSEYWIPFIKNIYLKIAQKRIDANRFNYKIIKNASKSFKYYETILFGQVLEILNQNYSSIPTI